MKLLILGGTGFFGKSILDRFIKLELKKYNINSVCVFSRNADTFLKKYPEFNNKNIKYIKGDITSIKFLPEADIVIHAATSASQINYLVNPEGEKQNIILGTFNYTQLAKKFHNNAKIVYCSSGAVYGKQPNEKKGINVEQASIRYFKEMTYEEISKSLNIPIGTVKAQLHRSREQLFKIMSGSRNSI